MASPKRNTSARAASANSSIRAPKKTAAEKRGPCPAPEAKPKSSESSGRASASPEPAGPPRGERPVRIGEALRQRGFDEHMIAASYVDVAERLRGKSDRTGSVEKLLVDVLKECSRHLEPSRTPEGLSGRPGAGAPVLVELVHNVLRPARGASGEGAAAQKEPANAPDIASEGAS